MKTAVAHLVCVLVVAAMTTVATAGEKFAVLRAGADAFTNVTVTAVTATHVQFQHSRGMASVKIKDLSPEAQKQLGFDAEKAGVAEKSQREADARYRAEAAARKTPAKSAPPKAEAGPDVSGDDFVAPRISAKSVRGQQAPKFFVEQWMNPSPDTKGKFVLIDFWATWCGPCRASIPHLNALQARFKDQLVVIGLSDEPLATVKAMKSPKIEYASGVDTQGRMQQALEVRGIPHAILIDPKGIVRFEGHPGYLEDAVVARLLKKYSN